MTTLARQRPLVAVVLAAVLAGLVPAPAVSAQPTPAESAAITVTAPRSAGVDRPLGIDDTTPTLDWRLAAPARERTQTAYQVQAATRPELVEHGRPDLWDTGRVAGAEQRRDYAGKAVASRTRVYWRVRVWSGPHVSPWSAITWFETGLLDRADWSARWISDARWRLAEKAPAPVVLTLPRTTARLVRLDVTRLGAAMQEQFPDWAWRLQLAEIEVRDSSAPEVNLAAGAAVTASESDTVRKTWEPGFLVDGQRTSQQAAAGFSSKAHAGPDLAASPIQLTLDLRAEHSFDQVLLYPRTDALSPAGGVPHFPVDFAIATASTSDGPFTVRATSTGQQPPAPWLPEALPLLAKEFQLPATRITSARLYVSGLGGYVPSINGQRVGDAVLAPGDTEYTKRVTYASYDVTGLLRPGANAVGIQLGNGIANLLNTADRYRKYTQHTSDPQAIAQLEVRLADGTTRRIGTDATWSTALGPTTASNWYGGEDYDARRAIPGWDAPGLDRTGWRPAVTVSAPTPQTELSGMVSEPVRVIERMPATLVGTPAPGVRVYDIGKNSAALPSVSLTAPAGLTFRIRPAESLKDGRAFQSISNVGSPIWDSYTTRDGAQSWHPEFTYHGFRYLEITGPEDVPISVAGLRVQADNASAGEFDSSNDIVNGIHALTRRALSSNMTSILTDCPSREKLGWLEQSQLVFDTVARNYDVQAYLRKIVRDMADAQTPDGLVPNFVPEHTVMPGAYRNDANWGGALVLVPWQLYRTYGDVDTLRTHYPAMRRYVDFLTAMPQFRDGILDYGLGDWFTSEKPMPRAVVGTFGYWRVADALARIAEVLGHRDDAAGYRAAADRSAAAVWTTFYDPATGRFGGGGMGATAVALDMGAAPEQHRASLLDQLVRDIEAADWHLMMGEVTFPSVLRVLSTAGRDDVVYRVASQTTSPSLGYQVVHGNTTLGESWDGGAGQSQNHFMLGALDGWLLRRLTGIDQTDDSIGFRRLRVDPAVVGDLTRANGSYTTPYGTVSTSWRRDAGRYELQVTLPVGVTAEIAVPIHRDATGHVQPPTANGARLVRVTGDRAVFEAGAGTWTFRSRVPENR